jgi:hypothetical protein
MGLQRSSFPDLGLLGDSVFTYNLEKESEIQAEHDDLWLKEYKKKKGRTHSGDSSLIYAYRTGKRVDGRLCTTIYDRCELRHQG